MDIILIKAFLGFLGTLIVLFLRLTGALPRPWFDVDLKLKGGEIEDITERIKQIESASEQRNKDIEDCRKILDLKEPSPDQQIKEFEAIMQSYKMQMENDAHELKSLRERKFKLEDENKRASVKNWSMAAILYIVIGSLLAAFLAPDPTQNGELVLSEVWQVIVWGGGWVAFVSLADFGKLDSDKKKIWTENIDHYEKEIEEKVKERTEAIDTANKVISENKELRDIVERFQTILGEMKG